MENQYSRTQMLLGAEGLERLRRARVILFGLGGVGGHAAEVLARSGIGQIDLVDNDTVSVSNLNRQLLATRDTVGQYKVDIAAGRIHSIDPEIQVRTWKTFFLPETQDQFDFTQYDYVLDAIDTVSGKLAIITCAKAAGVRVISCMGTGNKLDPTAFRVADISKTSGCALARIMRKECSKRGLKGVKVVYSQETPAQLLAQAQEVRPKESACKPIPGSSAFVPGVAGMIMAGEAVKELAGIL